VRRLTAVYQLDYKSSLVQLIQRFREPRNTQIACCRVSTHARQLAGTGRPLTHLRRDENLRGAVSFAAYDELLLVAVLLDTIRSKRVPATS
jgi:hypothetical protein